MKSKTGKLSELTKTKQCKKLKNWINFEVDWSRSRCRERIIWWEVKGAEALVNPIMHGVYKHAEGMPAKS